MLAALNEYIPYLFALSRGLSGAGPADEAGNGDGDGNPGKIEVVSRTDTEIEVSWRPTLNSGSAVSVQRFKRGARVKGRGIAFEMGFVLSTLGYVLSCVARTRCLSTIYAMKTPTAEEKTAAMAGAIRNLLLAASVHRHLAETATTPSYSSSSSSPTTTSDSPIVLLPPDLSPSTQSALSSLALAEATLLAVLKDDAYVSACIQARNPFDNEWMVKPPEIPKVRTLLLARLCVRAAEYAEQAAASAGSAGGSAAGGRSQDGVDEEVLGYMRVLGRVGRAKACRFFGVDAEMAGRVGEGIAWLRAGRAALGGKGAGASSLGGDGPRAQSEGKSTKGGAIGGGFSRLRREWSERREERKVEKEAGGGSGGSEKEAELLDWGDDAGREEEARVIDMLEAKWAKMNDTVRSSRAAVCSKVLVDRTRANLVVLGQYTGYPVFWVVSLPSPVWPGYSFTPGAVCSSSTGRRTASPDARHPRQ